MKQPLADGLQMHEDNQGRHTGQLKCFSGGAGGSQQEAESPRTPGSTEQQNAAEVLRGCFGEPVAPVLVTVLGNIFPQTSAIQLWIPLDHMFSGRIHEDTYPIIECLW